MQIPVSVKIVLGSATMPVAEGAQAGPRLGRAAGPQSWRARDVVANGRVVAQGEVAVLDEDSSRFGVSLTEVIGTMARLRAIASIPLHGKPEIDCQPAAYLLHLNLDDDVSGGSPGDGRYT